MSKRRTAGTVNPHLWMDVGNAIRYVERIGEQLAAVDAAHASVYEAGAAAYGERLTALDDSAREEIGAIPAERRGRLLPRRLPLLRGGVRARDRRHGHRRSGAGPSAGEIADLIDAIRARVQRLFGEAQFNPQLAQTVAEEAGIAVVTDLYTDSLGGRPPTRTRDDPLGRRARRCAPAMTAPFDPHEHPHRHPDERQPPSLEDRAVADPEHARSHASVWLTGVTAGYDHRAALETVDLAVEPGTLLAIVGPNGAGKSTLLKLMAGLLQPWEGRIEVLGEPPDAGTPDRVRAAGRARGLGVPGDGRRRRDDGSLSGASLRRPGPGIDCGHQGLEQVGMAEHRSVQIGQLSGGQRRRVFLARALAADPDLYLLDEPDRASTRRRRRSSWTSSRPRPAAARPSSRRRTTSPAPRSFQKVATVNRRIVAHGPASLVLDPNVLAATCWRAPAGPRRQAVVLDDAHHHDQESGRSGTTRTARR